MAVTFEPHKRLEDLETYVRNIQLNLTPDEARIQLLRCRLVGYRLIAKLKQEGYTREYVDKLFGEAYQALSNTTDSEIADPYLDPCTSQYLILDELKSYTCRDISEPFMRLLRAEFKKVFVPTLRLMTDLCQSKNKFSWEEVKLQLQEVMIQLQVDVDWADCERNLKRYLDDVAPVMGLK